MQAIDASNGHTFKGVINDATQGVINDATHTDHYENKDILKL